MALGISVPKMWAGLMARIIGVGPAEKLLQFAVMLGPAEAKQLGLIDDIAPRDGLRAAAEAAMQQMLKAPDFSRAVRAVPGDWGRQLLGSVTH